MVDTNSIGESLAGFFASLNCARGRKTASRTPSSENVPSDRPVHGTTKQDKRNSGGKTSEEPVVEQLENSSKPSTEADTKLSDRPKLELLPNTRADSDQDLKTAVFEELDKVSEEFAQPSSAAKDTKPDENSSSSRHLPARTSSLLSFLGRSRSKSPRPPPKDVSVNTQVEPPGSSTETTDTVTATKPAEKPTKTGEIQVDEAGVKDEISPVETKKPELPSAKAQPAESETEARPSSQGKPTRKTSIFERVMSKKQTPLPNPLPARYSPAFAPEVPARDGAVSGHVLAEDKELEAAMCDLKLTGREWKDSDNDSLYCY